MKREFVDKGAVSGNPGRRAGAGALVIACAVLLGAAVAPTGAQVANPVYVDDSPAASDTLLRVRDHLATGNLSEAARILQLILTEMPDRLVCVGAARGKLKAGASVVAAAGAPSIGSDDRDLFTSVRTEANRVLLAAPELLERYRQLYEPVAQSLLTEGRVDDVERSYLLTSSGYEAALRVAQRQMEDAKFQGALITLGQLEKHPDRTGEKAKAAGALAAEIARYVDDASGRELAARWSGAEPQGPVQWPALARVSGTTPLDTGARADLGAVLGKPLRSVPVIDDVQRSILQTIQPAETERLPATARHLLVLPTVADDTLYLNDGLQISAWDRITLAPKWVVRGEIPPGDEAMQAATTLRTTMRGNPSPEDPTTVTVSGRTAVAPLGLALGLTRWPDARLVAIDTLTGKVKWAVAVDELDPSLASQTVRGPAAVSEGTVVVAMRASLPDRRMVTLYQAGLDLATGQLQWHHLLGSTGALPYKNDAYVAEAAEVRDGVVYHSDMLGVVSATEASTGRPVWVRRMPPLSSQTWDALNPWQIGEPVIDGPSLITLSPDHRQVVRLDTKTGELRGWAPATRFDPQQQPRYLVRVGGNLSVVFDNKVALTPIGSFETAPVRVTPTVAEPGINGRVSAAGSKLLVPVVEGVLVVDADNPGAEPSLMPLDNPGNVLALESQLLVVDDVSVHSYLLWEVAERLLTQRMKEAPGDPTSAATLAELAYRAGRQEQIVGAADAALAALKLKPDAEETEPTRARLFASLQSMVTDSLEPKAEAEGPAAEAGAPRITADALLGDLVERMRRAAKTPEERLAYMLSLGRLQEKRKDATAAVDTYQGILDDETLAGATWSGPRLSTRGELEVTRRLESIVSQQGAGVYAKQEAVATEQAAKLGSDAKPEEIMRLATRYPVARLTAGLWERAAEAYKRIGRDHAVVGALESALLAAERIPGAPDVGEVTGRLIAELESRQQYAAAGNALKNVMERHPGVGVMIDGQQIDPKDLTAHLAQMVAARQRWPRVGDLRNEGVQVINGWALMEPLMRVRSGVSPRGVVLKSADQIALYIPSEPGPGAATGAADLIQGWTRPIDTDMFELVRLDSEAAYFFYASQKGAVVEKVSQSPAALKWQTPLFAEIPMRPLTGRPGRREMEPRILTPQDGMALLTDGVITMDDRTMVFLERQGYATALDTQSGAALWTVHSPLDRVYDAAVLGGTLVVAGDQEVRSGPGERVGGLRPEIVVLDARTGQEIQRLPQRWGGVRWVRMTDSGQLIAGCENAIVSTDLSRGQVNWVLSDPHLSTSRDAWVFQNAVFILDRDRRLWWADARNGQVSPDALDAPHGRLEGVRRIDASLLAAQGENGSPLVAFSTFQGVLLYDLAGNLKGVDAIGSLDGLLPPEPAQDRLVTISTMPDGRRNDRDLLYTIHMLDTKSAMVLESVPIVLGVPPRSMALLDGRVVITSGGTTLAVPAPAAPDK
jgi:outer membrane protein assembly factor BamB